MPYSFDWFSANIPNWEAWTGDLKGRPIRALEVGSFEGRSSRWIVDYYDVVLDCVDTWDGSTEHSSEMRDGLYDRFRENLSDAIEAGKIRLHRGLSQEVLPKLMVEGEKYDLIYIDGSHTSRDTLSDAIMGFSMLKEGGVMIFDDYEWVGFPHPLKNPRTGIDAFLRVYEGCFEMVGKGYQVAIRKTSDAWLYEA